MPPRKKSPAYPPLSTRSTREARTAAASPNPPSKRRRPRSHESSFSLPAPPAAATPAATTVSPSPSPASAPNPNPEAEMIRLLANIHTEQDVGNTVLAIMHKFRHGAAVLRKVLRTMDIRVCLSNVSYADMAPLVGLSPTLRFNDAPRFPILRARLPEAKFQSICSRLQSIIKEYGPARDHSHEEARSRYVAPILNEIVSIFQLLIQNSPETLIQGRFASSGRIEYYYQSFGALSVLFVEVKLKVGSGREWLDTIAQVIAECDACDFQNEEHHFRSRIHGILCDGQNFEFFEFERTNTETETGFVFRRGQYAGHLTDLQLPLEVEGNEQTKLDFIRGLRPISEVIFWVVLRSFNDSVATYLERSMAEAQAEQKPRKSTDHWQQAQLHAQTAMVLAEEAAHEHAIYRSISDPAQASTKEALRAKVLRLSDQASEMIEKSVAAIPRPFRRDINFMNSWDETVAFEA